MRIFNSFIFLIQVNYFVVYATNSQITYTICSNSTNVIFTCGVNTHTISPPNSEKSTGAVTDTPVPSFENFKSENQVSENAHTKPENKESSQEITKLAPMEKKSLEGKKPEIGDVRKADQEKKEETKADSKDSTHELLKIEASSENISEVPKEDEQVTPTSNAAQENKSVSLSESDTIKRQTPVGNVDSEKKKPKKLTEIKTDAKPARDDVKESLVEHVSSPNATTFECYWEDKSLKTYSKTNVVSIQYRDCHFPQLPSDATLLYTYENLRIFNVSKLGLKEFETMKGGQKLEIILASHNNLSKIHANSIQNLKSLTTIDLSHNHITEIEPMAFDDLLDLKFLNLSFNSLGTVEPRLFAKLLHLQHLDLSHNKFTIFNDQLFASLLNLETLILSNNQIDKINAPTFNALRKLKHLDLSNLKLSSIQSGTFSTLLALQTLNLSDNFLTNIDFEPLEAFVNCSLINLNGNQLTDLSGFKKNSFPKLESFGITNNQFSCTYLEMFLKSVDSKSINFTCGKLASIGDNINGVSCKKVDISMEKYVTGTVDNIECTSTIKVTSLLICILILVIVIFIVIIRRKITKASGRAAIYELTVDAEGRREGKAIVCT